MAAVAQLDETKTLPGDLLQDPKGHRIERAHLARQLAVTEELSLREQLILLERITRFATGQLAGTGQAPLLESELRQYGEATWDQRESLAIPPEQAQAIALQLFKSSLAKPGETVVIETTSESLPITEAVAKLCYAHGIKVRYDFRNHAREAIFAKHVPDTSETEGQASVLQTLASTRMAIYEAVGKTIRILTNSDPAIRNFSDPRKSDLWANKMAPLIQRLRSGDLHYILTYLPTVADATLDGMEHADYLRLFLEACDQPWESIKAAQKGLKKKFDAANALHITNGDGTDLTLDITGQTFANSVVLKNLPGSEIFSSPVREGVNGRIVSKGRFQFRNSGVIEDITLVFEQGRIIDFDARVGKDALGQIINMDNGTGEGTRYLGEIGIGTNPHLRRHMINPLLVEKIGGSFHVAIGSCYSYDSYDGQPVQLKNGNRSESGVHWDVTTLLRGKNGKMELGYKTPEGESTELVQHNGQWLPQGCEVLNRGWGAMPTEQQPDWWKERYPKGYQQA